MIKIGFIEVRWADIVDIMLVTILIYYVFKIIRGSVAFSIFVGFLSIYSIYLLLNALGMRVFSSILGQFMEVGSIALIILFQQEIRRFLQLIGGTTSIEKISFHSISNRLFNKKNTEETINTQALSQAIKTMAEEKTGALIIISLKSKLRYYADTGERLDAPVNRRLLLSIFNKYGPLHDGAILIHQNIIVAAGCVLPLSNRRDLPSQFGTRHRAALGMSEVTEALIVVVSEETGSITLVQSNHFLQKMPHDKIKYQLEKYIETGNLLGEDD